MCSLGAIVAMDLEPALLHADVDLLSFYALEIIRHRNPRTVTSTSRLVRCIVLGKVVSARLTRQILDLCEFDTAVLLRAAMAAFKRLTEMVAHTFITQVVAKQTKRVTEVVTVSLHQQIRRVGAR